MKRVFGLLLLSLIALVLLAAVGLGVVLATFDPNAYKERISAVAEKTLGRRIRFEGTLETSFFPAFNLKTGPFTVFDADSAEEEPFLSVQAASLSIALEPLASRLLVVEDILLRDCVLYLTTDEHGRHNWERTFSDTEAASAQDGVTPLSDPAPIDDADDAAPQTPAFQVQMDMDVLTLENLRINYRNRQRDHALNIVVDEFALTDPARDKDMPLLLSGTLSADTHNLRAKFHLKGMGKITDSSVLHLDIEELAALAEGIGQEALSVDAAGTLMCNTRTGAFFWSGVSGVLAGTAFSTEGSFTPAASTTAAQLQGRIHVQELNWDAVSRHTAFSPGARHAKTPKGTPNLPMPVVYSAEGGAFMPLVSETEAMTLEFGDAPEAPRETGPDLAVDIGVDRLLLGGIPCVGLAASVRREREKAYVPFDCNVYGGAVQGRAELQCDGDVPSLDLAASAKGVDLSALTRELGRPYTLSGLLGCSLTVTGRGATGQEILHSLNGTAKFSVGRGEIEGFSLIPDDLQGLEAIVPARVPFESISASLNIKDGLARTKDIRLRSSVLSARGGGNIRLGYGQLDLGIDFMPGGKPPAVPVSLYGPYAALSSSVDMRTFVRNVAESALTHSKGAKGHARDAARGRSRRR